MTNSVKSFFKLSTLLCLILVLSGCAEIGFTVPAAAVSGGAAGVNYSFTNNAYKTISYPVADVEAALNKAFKKMDIQETKHQEEEGKVSISAVAGDLAIYVDLEKVTPTVTKIEVNAKKGAFFKDKATATEIIVQTEKNLEVKK
jgi:PBP1b-binding outer membrane lipoprotein LpoB